jgi:hypothetical protein
MLITGTAWNSAKPQNLLGNTCSNNLLHPSTDIHKIQKGLRIDYSLH